MSRQNKVKRWRLALMDDQSHDVLWVVSRSRAVLICEFITVLFLFAAVVVCIVAYTPLRTTIPGYPDAKTRRAAIQTALEVDSLQNIVSRWELYSGNLLRIVEGQEPLQLDSLVRMAAKPDVTEEDIRLMHEQDSLLRAMVTAEEQRELSARQTRRLSIESMHFFPPLRGAVSRGFEPLTHPYLELTAPAGSVVMAALGGSVISTAWSDENGFELVMQHDDDIVTIYRHLQKILVKTGDRLNAGASVALIGDSGSLGGDHLQFELWYKGDAVDPVKYIKF